MVLFGVVRATGAVMPPLFMLIIALWCVRVPFAYSLLRVWHAEAIWWSFPVASVASLVLATLYYRFGGWRKVRMGMPSARAVPVTRA
jgi:Na+-driven multidrug efflux pump